MFSINAVIQMVTFNKLSTMSILALKEAVDLSFVEYKQAKSRVTKALYSTRNERSLGNKMQQLADALTKLNIHHTIWVHSL